MIWIAPSEKDTGTESLESRPWAAADQFRANSGLKSQEYAAPVVAVIQNLRRTRDPLLPRLLSRQVELRDTEVTA